MYRLKVTILMLCLILSGALCYASGAAGTENEKGEGTPIYEYLNEEYAQIMQHTHSQYMEIRPYGHDGYFQTMVFGKKRLNNPGFLPELFNISHVVQEWHATILESVNTNYPVPIDE